MDLLHFTAGIFSLPSHPQTQGVLVVVISFQIRFWFNKNPLKHRFLSVWQGSRDATEGGVKRGCLTGLEWPSKLKNSCGEVAIR